MNEPRSRTARAGPSTATIIGFTPLERAGLALLLDEAGIGVCHVVTDVTELVTASAVADIALVDLTSAVDDEAERDEIRSFLRSSRDSSCFTVIFGMYRGFSGSIPRTLAGLDFDALIDTQARPESLLSVITGATTARRAWNRPTISVTPLTPRERQIVSFIAAGRTSRAIAATLGISVHTVESHKQRVFRRLGVQNQAQAVSVALRLGLLDGGVESRGAAS